MIEVLSRFIPVLLRGCLVNLEIGIVAVAIGLAFGLPLAVLRHRASWSRGVVRIGIRLMQAAPVYVIMFFMLNLFPRQTTVFGFPVAFTGYAAVVLSLGINMIAYAEEAGLDALQRLDRGERAQALLFFPNMLRGFVSIVMASGIAAAIGVPEAVGLTMQEASRLPELGSRVTLFLVVMAVFSTVFGAANIAVTRLVGWLSRRGANA